MTPEATEQASKVSVLPNTVTIKPQKDSTSVMQAVARRWWERGHANHGWLRSFFSFSFANYYDPAFMSFGPLRVINEDRVLPQTGFPTHPHANAEIFSYILGGELTHKDSLGNVEVLKRGEVQFTSAGSGIRHSEYNDHKSKECHFLQIWYTPSQRNLTPKYYTLPQVPDEDKTNKFMTLIRDIRTFSNEEQQQSGLLPKGRAIPAHSSLCTRACILSPGHHVKHTLGSETTQKEGERWAYVHLAMTSGWKDADARQTQDDREEAQIKVMGKVLREGDGVFLRHGKVGEEIVIENTGQSTSAELLLFDVEPGDSGE